jgi:hypothetical protein
MSDIVTRWPGAVLRTAELTAHVVDAEGRFLEERREPCWEALPGRGSRRRYDFQGHRAAWRNFSETLLPEATSEMDGIAAYDRDKLRAFIQKYGPVYQPDSASENYGSVLLACHLRTIAAAWGDDPERSTVIAAAIDPAWRQAGYLLERGFRARGQLDGRLVQAAIGHLSSATVMRRCAACHNWIELDPPTRRYCGPSCRTLAAQARAREG